MQVVLPLTVVGDAYTYFRCPRTAFVTLKVYNNGVDVGFGSGFPQADYPASDEYYALENATAPRLCDEIRFKNHVPGQSAQIQITCQQSADLPSGNPLAVGNTPNFLTIDSQGRPGATFAGKVKASELDLQVSPNAAPINWVNAAGGVLATITGDASGNLTLGPGTVSFSGLLKALGLSLSESASGFGSTNSVQWVDAGGNVQAFLGASRGGTVNHHFLEAQAGNAPLLLWDDQSKSDFVQMANGQKATLMWGRVNANGTVQQAGSGDWSVVRNSVGNYTITTPVGPTFGPLPLGGMDFGSQGYLTCYPASSSTVSVATLNGSGVLTDSNWLFLVILF